MTEAMTLAEISNLSAYELARMADCSEPDRSITEGAKMLDSVRDGVLAAIDGGRITLDDFNDDGQLSEIADDAPSIWTATKWAQFVDLGAYQEEPEYDDAWPSDLDKAASVALYQIAERLAYALCEAWREGWECPTCTNPRGDYDCSEDDCRAWQCPECGGYDNTHGCQIDECKAPETAVEALPVRVRGEALTQALTEYVVDPEGPSMEVDDMYVNPPAEAVLTGPVDLPPVHDPILDLIDRADACDMGIRVTRAAMAHDRAVSRFRRKVWTVAGILAAVSVPVIMWIGGVW